MGRTSDAKARLIHTAMKLFLAQGYHCVGVSEICEQAGVNKGSFYHFFPAKRDLVVGAIEAYTEVVVQMIERVSDGDGTPLEKLEQLFAVICDRQNEWAATSGNVCGCPIGNLALELSAQDNLVREKLQESLDQMTLKLRKIIVAGIESGQLPRYMDPDRTARAMVAYIEGLIMLAKAYNDPNIISQLGPSMVRWLGRTESIETT